MTSDNRSTIDPSKTPMFIGAGVTIQGVIRHEGPQDEKAVILGTLEGDMEWNGILQVPRGGRLEVQKSLKCREIMVGGEIVGASDDVVIETGLLRLGESAVVEVATVSVPPGGLEQSRGSVINAKLRMSKEHPYADHQETAPAAPASHRLQLASVTAIPDAGVDEAVQIETARPPFSVHA